MNALVQKIVFRGIDVILPEVQVHSAHGLPAIDIIGSTDKAVAESREGFRVPLVSIDLTLRPKRIVVNLESGNVVKEREHVDLPIALGLLVAMGVAP